MVVSALVNSINGVWDHFHELASVSQAMANRVSCHSYPAVDGLLSSGLPPARHEQWSFE